MKIQTVNSLAELNNVAKQLPTATIVPLYEKDGTPITEYVGIRNDDTKEIVRVFTKDYSLVQHGEVLETVSEVLTELGLKGKAELCISRDGARLSAYIVFDEKIIKDDNQGIQFGIKIDNSFDGGQALKFSSFGRRLACYNGMVINQAFKNQVIYHYKIKEAKPRIAAMVREAINRDDAFQAIVNNAMKESFAWQALQKFILDLIQSERWLAKKHLDKILEKIGVSLVVVTDKKTKTKKYRFVKEEGVSLKKWDLYNAFTEYISHNDKLSYSLRSVLERISERVLIAPTMA